jgi:hypothetical protein
MPGESARARLVKSAGASRFLCAGNIVLDGIGTAKDCLKSTFSGTPTGERWQNLRLWLVP